MCRLCAVSDGLDKRCTIVREQFAELLGLTRVNYVKSCFVGGNFLKQNQISNLTLDKAVADADIHMLFNRVVLRAKMVKGAAECFWTPEQLHGISLHVCLV